MVDGRRKSIQPMAARLGGVHEQALNHFATNSPWEVEPVRDRIAEAARLRSEPVLLTVTWSDRFRSPLGGQSVSAGQAAE
jgi:hypothetical protein